MNRPLRCALIGIGTRAKKLYLPLLGAVAPWLKVSAVCSPNAGNAAEVGAELGVPHFTTLSALLAADLIDAAVVLSPIESHHAISVTLSRHGIHHLVETTMASTLTQARDMARQARQNGVTMLVAENYFRFPFDRLAKAAVASGAIGDVHRITSMHDQVGFHGHARWIKFYDAYPEAVQSIEHLMPTQRHVESARRIHDSETFRTCHLYFPGGRVAIDMGGNAKGLLGRMPRPGYTEIDGSRGAIVRMAGADLGGVAELRHASELALARDGKADHVAPFRDHVADGTWVGSDVTVPGGMVEIDQPYRPGPVSGPKLREWDAAVVMEILVQFAEQVQGTGVAEFSADDAVMATEVEAACRESALRGGERIALPVDVAPLQSEVIAMGKLRRQFGLDPFDVEAMLAVHFPPAA
jgi:predicted dehydrogenase